MACYRGLNVTFDIDYAAITIIGHRPEVAGILWERRIFTVPMTACQCFNASRFELPNQVVAWDMYS
jgi:hypothetical protein